MNISYSPLTVNARQFESKLARFTVSSKIDTFNLGRGFLFSYDQRDWAKVELHMRENLNSRRRNFIIEL